MSGMCPHGRLPAVCLTCIAINDPVGVEIRRAYGDLMAVLADPEGTICVGSAGDGKVIAEALNRLLDAADQSGRRQSAPRPERGAESVGRIYNEALRSAKGDGSETNPHLAALINVWAAAQRATRPNTQPGEVVGKEK